MIRTVSAQMCGVWTRCPCRRSSCGKDGTMETQKCADFWNGASHLQTWEDNSTTVIPPSGSDDNEVIFFLLLFCVILLRVSCFPPLFMCFMYNFFICLPNYTDNLVLSSTGIQHTNVNSDLSSIWIVSLSFWLVSLMKYRVCEVCWHSLTPQQRNQHQHFQWSCIKEDNFWSCCAVLASLTQWKGEKKTPTHSWVALKAFEKRRETGDLKTGVWPASGAVGVQECAHKHHLPLEHLLGCCWRSLRDKHTVVKEKVTKALFIDVQGVTK